MPEELLQVLGREKEEVMRRIKNSGLRAQGKLGDVEDNYEVGPFVHFPAKSPWKPSTS
jgi:hypothetical protein